MISCRFNRNYSNNVVTRSGSGRRICLGLMLCLGMLAHSVPAEVLVIVNGDSITTSDMDLLFMGLHRTLPSADKGSFEYRKLVDKMVNDRLLIQEAIAMGMDSDDDFLDQISEERQKLARRLFILESFVPEVDTSKKKIEAHFSRYYWKVKLRSLALTTEAEAEQRLEEVRHGASMDSIAKETSLDSRRFRGGLTNLMYWNDVPQILRNEAFALKEGEFSRVFPYQDAFMFLRLEERHDANSEELPRWTKEITTILTNIQKADAWQKFVDSLSAIYSPTIDSTLLSTIDADSLIIFHGQFLKTGNQNVITIGQDLAVNEEELRRKISHTAMSMGDQDYSAIHIKAISNLVQDLTLRAAASHDGFE
ncbi:MAG: peptidyl-prolyl cis-trans isomerase, partial [candidate division Zixibacteria bacterium]